MKRFDVVADTPRKKDNGYAWTVKIGSAFARDDGSVDIVLDALPLTVLDSKGNASVRLKLWPAKADDARPVRGAPAQQGARGGDDYDADVPF